MTLFRPTWVLGLLVTLPVFYFKESYADEAWFWTGFTAILFSIGGYMWLTCPQNYGTQLKNLLGNLLYFPILFTTLFVGWAAAIAAIDLYLLPKDIEGASIQVAAIYFGMICVTFFFHFWMLFLCDFKYSESLKSRQINQGKFAYVKQDCEDTLSIIYADSNMNNRTRISTSPKMLESQVIYGLCFAALGYFFYEASFVNGLTHHSIYMLFAVVLFSAYGLLLTRTLFPLKQVNRVVLEDRLIIETIHEVTGKVQKEVYHFLSSKMVVQDIPFHGQRYTKLVVDDGEKKYEAIFPTRNFKGQAKVFLDTFMQSYNKFHGLEFGDWHRWKLGRGFGRNTNGTV